MVLHFLINLIIVFLASHCCVKLYLVTLSSRELTTQMIFVVFFLQIVAAAAQQVNPLDLAIYLLVSHSRTEAALAVRYYSHLNQVRLKLYKVRHTGWLAAH